MTTLACLCHECLDNHSQRCDTTSMASRATYSTQIEALPQKIRPWMDSTNTPLHISPNTALIIGPVLAALSGLVAGTYAIISIDILTVIVCLVLFTINMAVRGTIPASEVEQREQEWWQFSALEEPQAEPDLEWAQSPGMVHGVEYPATAADARDKFLRGVISADQLETVLDSAILGIIPKPPQPPAPPKPKVKPLAVPYPPSDGNMANHIKTLQEKIWEQKKDLYFASVDAARVTSPSGELTKAAEAVLSRQTMAAKMLKKANQAVEMKEYQSANALIAEAKRLVSLNKEKNYDC